LRGARSERDVTARAKNASCALVVRALSIRVHQLVDHRARPAPSANSKPYVRSYGCLVVVACHEHDLLPVGKRRALLERHREMDRIQRTQTVFEHY